jgi:hypothetical protein
VLDASGVDHLARHYLEVALLLGVPAPHVAAVEPDHNGSGRPRRGRGQRRLHDLFADPPRPVPHRAGVRRAADREQLGQERGHLAEGGQGRIPGRDVGELGRDRAAAEIEDCEARRPIRALAGAGQQPPNPDRHRAEQRAEGRPVVPLAGQQSVTSRTPAAPLARGGHLRRYDLGLQRRGEPLHLLEPEAKVGQSDLLATLNAGDLCLGHHPGLQLRDQLHPPHQLRHRPPTPQ